MTQEPDNAAFSPPFPPPDLQSAEADLRSAKAEPPPPAPSPGENPEPAGPRPRRVRELKPRQYDFCAYYVAGGNVAEAARRAGYTERYAHNQGHRLLKDARIRAQIRAIQTEIAHTVEPGMILGRLDDLCSRAERKGDYREAARILESMSRLVGIAAQGAAAHLRTPEARDENDDK